MNLSEFFNKAKILPIAAVILLIVTIALPLLFSSNDEQDSFEVIDEVADIEVLLDSKLDGFKGEGAFSGGSTHETDSEALRGEKPQEVKEEKSDRQKEANLVEKTRDPAMKDALGSGKHELADVNLDGEMQKQEESHGEQKGEHAADSMMSHGEDGLGTEDAAHQEEKRAFQAERVCYEIGPVIDDAQKNKLESIFRGRGINSSLVFHNVKRELGYWVFLPPLRSLALARLKVEEIKLKGIKDVNVLINHEPKLAISLGIFNEQKNANKRLLKVQSLGFEAKMDIRAIEENQLWLSLESSRERDFTEQEWTSLLQEHNPIELKSINCF